MTETPLQVSDRLDAPPKASPSLREIAVRIWRFATARRPVDPAEAALQAMTSDCRRVFVLRMVDRLSYDEIADRLGVSRISVEKRLLRAFAVCADFAEARDVRRTLSDAP